MALKTKDAYKLINLIAEQATGRKAITPVDTNGFVSMGNKLLELDHDSVFDAISVVMGRLFVANRPYTAKLNIINAINSGLYTNRIRKVSYYTQGALPTGAFNTDLYTNIKDGFSNNSNEGKSVAGMWEQNLSEPLEMDFSGRSAWDTSITLPKVQLQEAFRNEASFNQFIAGMMMQKDNEIELTKEAWRRMTILSRIGASYTMGVKDSTKHTAINLTEEFNNRYGTKYTSDELRGSHYSEFLAFFVARVKEFSAKMTNYTNMYHYTPPLTGKPEAQILRHTPYDRQRLVMYEPLLRDAESMVLPEIFHDDRLSMSNYEGVEYWQTFGSAEIDVKVEDFETGKPAEVKIPYLCGVLFDVDSVMTDFQLESATSTPLEARKKYRNLWWTFARNAIVDPTENCIIFYMADTKTM